MARKLDMVFDVLLLAANSAITCVDGVVGGAPEIFADLLKVLKFQGRLMSDKNNLKKRRQKVLEQLIQTFKAVQVSIFIKFQFRSNIPKSIRQTKSLDLKVNFITVLQIKFHPKYLFHYYLTCVGNIFDLKQ
jgi:hypothetical protein